MEVLITCCDFCNIDSFPSNPRKLPLDIAVALGMEDQIDENGDVWVNQGVFVGGFEAAQADGWEERDFGFICPLCVMNLQAAEGEDEVGVGLEAMESEIERKR